MILITPYECLSCMYFYLIMLLSLGRQVALSRLRHPRWGHYWIFGQESSDSTLFCHIPHHCTKIHGEWSNQKNVIIRVGQLPWAGKNFMHFGLKFTYGLTFCLATCFTKQKFKFSAKFWMWVVVKLFFFSFLFHVFALLSRDKYFESK